MNDASKKQTSLAFTGIAFALALALAGCGGGSDSKNSSHPASADMIASFNSIAEYCGEETRLPAADASPGYNNRLNYSMQRGTDSQDVSNIYSIGGSDSNNIRNQLKVDVGDLRGITTGVYVSVGLATVGEGMGVQMLPSLPSGGIACVKSVSWLKSLSTSPVFTGTASSLPVRTLVWSSRDKATLPISTLGSYPVDGFELVANFTPASGVAFFSFNKSHVADPSAIQICMLPNKASTWNCGLPKISDDTNRWIFSVDAAQPGVYMLTSSHPEAHF